MLYNILYNFDRSYVYSATTVDAADDSLNAAFHLAMDQAIPWDSDRKYKCPVWFSSSLEGLSFRLLKNLLL
jgi:hypothetical protein